MAGIPTVSTATTSHYTSLGQNHCSSSDNDETEPWEDCLSTEEEDYDEIESLVEAEDDIISTHNNNRQITKAKKSQNKTTTNPVLAVTTNPVLAVTTCAEAYEASSNHKAFFSWESA
jgi:hypothetical protein